MRWIRSVLWIALATAGCDERVASTLGESAPAQLQAPAAGAVEVAARSAPRARASRGRRHRRVREPRLTRVDLDQLCVTHGELARAHVEVPTFRAVAPEHAGDRAAMSFEVRGTTAVHRALASGQDRRQLGLKLRAEDGCNLVYVMWRLDPKPMVEVSVKRNPGERTAKECGADGYTKVRPLVAVRPPELTDGHDHQLRAEITGDMLVAWIDGEEVWRGMLPASARDLAGPAGVRSDNLELDLLGFEVDARRARTDKATTCKAAAESGD